MAKHKRVEAGDDGWSDWQIPIMDGYKMGCCDCGLVHTMEFKVIKIAKHNKDGSFIYEDDDSGLRVAMRGKRNERSTAAVRREKNKKSNK